MLQSERRFDGEHFLASDFQSVASLYCSYQGTSAHFSTSSVAMVMARAVGDDLVAAGRRLQQRHLNALMNTKQNGYSSVYAVGGSLTRTEH